MAESKNVGRPKKTATKKTTEKESSVEVKTKVLKQEQKKKIPLSYDISCKSGVQGGLTYVSKKNGYEIYWDLYGATEYLTFEELVAMRNGSSRFFKDNWIFFEDTEDYTAEEIYKALGIDRFYKSILEIDNIDEVLLLDADSLKKKVEHVPTGVKDAIITRAKQLMIEESDIMDSKKKIKVLEDTFDIELIPKDI